MDLTSKTGHIMHLNKYISLYIETKTSTIHINHTVMQSFSKVFFSINQNHKNWLTLIIQSEYNDLILYFSSMNPTICFHRLKVIRIWKKIADSRQQTEGKNSPQDIISQKQLCKYLNILISKDILQMSNTHLM